MNFPGLDPAWTFGHHATHTLGLTPTWSLPVARDALARGEKVLVVATTALGDSLLTTPLIETLSARLGRDRVSLLVKAPYVELYRDDPRLHRVFSVRGKYRWENLRAQLRDDPHRIALLANLTEPDLLPYLWWGGVRAFLRYRTRWSRHPAWIANSEMLRSPGSADYATGHAIENNLAMAEALGLEPATHRLGLPQIHGERKCRRVLIHPGASREIKRWPVENWARLAEALIAEFHVDVLITGDRNERPLAEAVRSAIQSDGHVEVTAGELSLRELAQAQGEAAVFISGDTGPYHLAVATGCPTVTLFAPTDRGSSTEACGPHQADPVFHRALETAVGDGIASISMERVRDEVRAVLGNGF